MKVKKDMINAHRAAEIVTRGKTYEEIHGIEKSLELRRRRSESNRKRIWTEESRKRASISAERIGPERAKRRWANTTLEERQRHMRPAQIASGQNCASRIELLAKDVLEELGIPFEWQKPFGRYIVDFYLPEFPLILECDGEQWHNVSYDEKRDSEIFSQFRIQTIRIGGGDLNRNAKAAILVRLMAQEAWIS